jgi:glycosyltransferase involved in cell wall biosynthesis
MPEYRLSFFEGLFARLRAKGIDFELRYGNAGTIFPRNVSYGRPFRRWVIFGRVVWFPVLWETLKADLVIVEHSNKILIIFPLFVAQFFGGPKLGFWGHGRNHQTDKPDSLGERIKIWMGRNVRWYFAYTGRVRDELIGRGYDPDRITDVQNAVVAPDCSPSQSDIDRISGELGLTSESIVGLFCGRMYPARRLEMLVAAAKMVHDKIPSFHLIMIGGGVSEGIAEHADSEHDFIHFVGPRFGQQRSAYYALARFTAFTGLVGLGLVDSFHYAVPAIVAENRFHGPELAYLSDGENALLTGRSATDFAESVMLVCRDDPLHETLKQGCKKWSGMITVDEMADRFAAGIEEALGDPAS